MAKNDMKTTQNAASVADFLATVTDKQQRSDCQAICDIMQTVSGQEPKMWGASIIGFGRYHYKYASGREGDWMRIGLSPRKGKTTLYFCNGFESKQELLSQLGSHETGKGCLYIKRLEDVDSRILKKLIQTSYTRPATGEV